MGKFSNLKVINIGSKHPKEWKWCTNCNKDKHRTEFYSNRTKSDGLTTWCKECEKLKVLEWTHKYPIKARAKDARRRTKESRKLYQRHWFHKKLDSNPKLPCELCIKDSTKVDVTGKS